MKGFSAAIEAIADHLFRDADRSTHILIGPVVWDRVAGKRRWYFNVGGGGPEGFHVDQIAGGDRALAEKMRAALFPAMTLRPPIVIHDFDDELAMARLAETIWPGAKTRDIRVGIEAERAKTLHESDTDATRPPPQRPENG